MYEDYKDKNQFTLDGMVKNQPYPMTLQSSIPFMPGGRLYMQMMNPDLKPVDFTDFRDETLSWHLTCSVSGGLNPTPMAVVKGPDAKKFMKDALVNKVDTWPVGTTKHGLMLTDDANIAAQGVILHTDEDTYEAHWLSPYFDYVFLKGNYDATLENITGQRVIFQTQGPNSLQMVENAAKEDLHDIKFGHFRNATIAGHKVRILRFGMYGCIGYEVHCAAGDSHDVYEALLRAGQPLGVRRLGFQAYMMDHTPGGSQQLGFHFMPSMDMEFAQAMMAQQSGGQSKMADEGLSLQWFMTGSLGEDMTKRLANPYMLGLDYVCDYSRDFRGREALEAYKQDPHRRNICTLEWNYEDLGDIYMSQYRDEEPYAPMDWPGKPWSAVYGGQDVEMDKVLDKDGREIGWSAGRTTDYWYRAMVSDGIIEESYINEGDELTIVWGNPGTRQKEVRAKVARFPYNIHLRNKDFDVEQVPHYKG
ncbi:MAG: hypothetical protein ACOYIK_10615 [Coriobacteriales bacterium]|jgi:vanillate/3-O-methylgallate O-demethylase